MSDGGGQVDSKPIVHNQNRTASVNSQKLIQISTVLVSLIATIAFLSYLLVLLTRTGYGSHETSVGTDVIWLSYLSAGIGLAGFSVASLKRWVSRGIGLVIVALVGAGLIVFLMLNQSGKVRDRSIASLPTMTISVETG